MDSNYTVYLKHTNLNYYSIILIVTNFGSQNISKSILEVYFIFRAQKYIFQQSKILIDVYIIYEAVAKWLGCRSTKTKIPGSKPYDG